HADDVEGFLLARGFFVEHADVHHDLAGLIVDAALKLDSHPAMAFVRAAIAPRYDRVCEREERSALAAFLAKPLDVEIKFAIEHRLEPVARNIPVDVPVNCVAHFHVVSRDALGDRARSAADPEKPAHHFLARADLRKRAVPARIKIDPERLRMGIERFLFHGVGTETY